MKNEKKVHALTKYEESYQKIAYDVLSKGKSWAAVAAALDVSVRTIHLWNDKYPDFYDACLRGRAVGQALQEELADNHMIDKNFNATLHIFKMKSQYRVCEESATVNVIVPAENADEIERVMTEIESRREY